MTMPSRRTVELNISPGLRNGLLAGLILVIGLAIIWFMQTQQLLSWDFRNNLWGPAHLLVRGQSPYRLEVLFDTGGAVWLPMVITALSPLGWLSHYQAAGVWFILNLAAVTGLVWLAADTRRPGAILFFLSLIAVFLFPATVAHLRLGQLSLIITLGFMLIVKYRTSLPVWLAAFLLAVIVSKPQLGILVLPGLFLVRWRSEGLRAVFILAGWLALWLAILAGPLLWHYPLWLNDFIAVQTNNVNWMHPSLFRLLPLIWGWGTIGLVVWAIIALVIFGLNIRLWLTQPADEAVLWSLALTPLITPYLWSWDFVMLIPLAVHIFFRSNAWQARLLLGLGYSACWLLMIWIELSPDINNYRYWWVPWFSLAVIGGIRWLEQKKFSLST